VVSARRLVFALAGLAGLTAAGCSPITWTRTTLNQPIHPADIAFITPGHTPWRDVTARLGAPSAIDPGAEGFIARYFFYDAADFDADLGTPLDYVGPISRAPHELDTGGTGIGGDVLTVVVDHSGVVTLAALSHADKTAHFNPLPTDH
jgi:hypothetical protein